jgi:hypothetical protein
LFSNADNASDLIQLSTFSDDPFIDTDVPGGSENYGVAPDFACGYHFYLPAWTGAAVALDSPFFVNKKAHDGDKELAGFFLAIFTSQHLVVMEAFDTWLHPEICFEQFKDHVSTHNSNMNLKSNQEAVYTTFFGNKIHFVIWGDDIFNPLDNHYYGAKIINIEYGTGDPADTLVDAGNYTDQSQFLSGTVLKSAGDAVTEIHNAFLGTKIKLDWSDPSHLVRTSEDGTVEEAGRNSLGQYSEAWVNFDWTGPFVGDFFQPFNTIGAAAAAVADGGVIKIIPGTTRETRISHANKRIRLVAPIGGVNIGGR